MGQFDCPNAPYSDKIYHRGRPKLSVINSLLQKLPAQKMAITSPVIPTLYNLPLTLYVLLLFCASCCFIGKIEKSLNKLNINLSRLPSLTLDI